MYQLAIIAAVILGGLALVFAGKGLYSPLEGITKIFVQVAIGVVCIVVFNAIASPFHFKLALNPITAGITGYLGLPGFIALLVMKMIVS